MRPVTRKTRDRIARWIGFLALVALLAMATLPVTPDQRDVAAHRDTGNVTPQSAPWHG
jgi:hypothetical protein